MERTCLYLYGESALEKSRSVGLGSCVVKAVLAEEVMAGLGIANLPRVLVEKELTSKEVVEIFIEYLKSAG
ncbi:hypothetical protein [Marinomonas epiphytica]